MDYSVPTARDLADVHSLNHALLKAMRGHAGASLRRRLPRSCQSLIAALGEADTQRLAETPFLLLSLHEQDDKYWQQLLEGEPQPDLFAVNDKQVDEGRRIVAAAIGFAWQLARRDAYVARLVCGASLRWCQRLASRPLIEVLGRTADRADLLVPRLAENENFWRRRRGAGLSDDPGVRNAARLAGLQMLRTGIDTRQDRRLPSAACRAAVPTIRM